ncbi:MAG: SGNH/GDSL hydrolase family protein [Planctomycetota bacterium]
MAAVKIPFNIDVIEKCIADPQRILLFGDSTSAYHQKTFITSQQISYRLNKAGIKHSFFNSSSKGNTTDKAKNSFTEEVLDYFPDLVILSFGSDDAVFNKDGKETLIPLNNFIENLRFLITQLKENSIEVIVCSTPPLLHTEYSEKLYGTDEINKDIRQFNNSAEMLAAESGCHFIDNYNAFLNKTDNLQNLLYDGVHPNEIGHQIIADKIWDFLFKNTNILEHRSEISKPVRHLTVLLPEENKKYTDFEIPLKLHLSRLPLDYYLEYRIKSEDSCTCHAWTGLSTTTIHNLITSEFSVPQTGQLALEFRIKDRNSESITAIGKTEYIHVVGAY